MSEWAIFFMVVVSCVATACAGFLVGYFLGWRLRGKFEQGLIGPQELRGRD